MLTGVRILYRPEDGSRGVTFVSSRPFCTSIPYSIAPVSRIRRSSRMRTWLCEGITTCDRSAKISVTKLFAAVATSLFSPIVMPAVGAMGRPAMVRLTVPR
jgi:hypothetical protein